MVERCIAPTEIEAGDLVAYLEGTASSRVGRHISRCPACAAQLEALRQTDTLFRQALTWAESSAIEPPKEIPAAARPVKSRGHQWFTWLNWSFQSKAWRPAAVAAAMILLLLSLQVGLYRLFNHPAHAPTAVAVREGVATVVVSVGETAEIIRTKMTAAESTGQDEVMSGLAAGRVIVEEMVEVAPPRSLRERIEQEFQPGTTNVSVYSLAMAKAERDRVSTRPGGKNYVVWTAEHRGQTVLYFVASPDGGRTWQPNVQINKGFEKVYNPNLVVDTDNGNLYVVWRSGYRKNANIYLARSTDNGHSWSRSVRVEGAIGRIFNPTLTTDDSGGVYVSWQDRDRASISIYFIHSADGGKTWNDKIRAANIGG